MITWVDWGIWAIYLAVIFTILWFYRHSKTEGIYKWFLKGFLIKVFGGVAFALISIYYYGGDTLLYFKGATTLSNYFFSDPDLYFTLLNTPNDLSSEYYSVSQEISYSRTGEEWFMVKILSVFSIFSFNSYLVLTLFMNIIAFVGGWKLFRVFTKIIQNSDRYVFIIVFVMPSVFFWGNGILKDTLTLALVNIIFFYLYAYFELQKISLIKSILVFMLSAYIIYGLKAYIVLAFLPSLIYLIYLYSKNKIKSRLIQLVIGPIIFAIFIGIGYFGIKNLSENTVYSANKIEKHIKGFHSWHTTTGGSSYSLGEIDYSPIGVLSKVPAALNATFFRPYIWNARNPIMLIGAIESAVVLGLFIYCLMLSKLRFIQILKSNKFILGLSIFVVLFGFAVGFTSYNFGALARYKMPVYPIFVFCLFYIIKSAKTIRT